MGGFHSKWDWCNRWCGDCAPDGALDLWVGKPKSVNNEPMNDADWLNMQIS